MKLIVGLGNPGKKHEGTRHNVGFVVVDVLANKLNIESWQISKNANALYSWAQVNDQKIELLKPQAFVNDSGKAVAYARNKHRELSIQDIYVIHDDLDIKLGEYKIQLSKGPKDHKGILSIEEKLGTKDFYRVRIGVENRTDAKISGEDYVLMKFTEEERNTIDKTVGEAVAEIVKIISSK